MDSKSQPALLKGRFAPSPSGRMHLGNVFTALMSWLSAKSAGGKWLLRIEDLDPQRSKMEYGRLIEDDLHWLGLDWDEGGIDGTGDAGPYCQSRRGDFYESALERLSDRGLTYGCVCTRAELMATQAPHQSDGRVVYAGTCRPAAYPPFARVETSGSRRPATRLYVPDGEIVFEDRIFGRQSVNLAHECGDFVVRRSDGAWAYQLAVVVDDAAMGVTEVVRGCDLLQSTAQQIYLYRLLGHDIPRFVHLPLICNVDNRRLSKRDKAADMKELRLRYTAEEVIGMIANMARITKEYEPCSAKSLIDIFDLSSLPRQEKIIQNIF